MALLTNGLETLEIGCVTWRELANANLVKLDQRTIVSGLLAARPAAGATPRFYYATDAGRLFHDTGAAWALVAGGAPPATVAVPLFGNVQATGAGNWKVWQKRVFLDGGATIKAAQVVGCDGVDPTKGPADLTVLRVSDTDWQQAGAPQGFDIELPGDQADARVVPASPLAIAAASYVHVFIAQAAGNHAGPKLLLELE